MKIPKNSGFSFGKNFVPPRLRSNFEACYLYLGFIKFKTDNQSQYSRQIYRNC